MPRPFPSPNSADEVNTNYLWLCREVRRVRPDRSPDWIYNAAYRVEDGLFFNGEPAGDVIDPHAPPRVRARDEEMGNNMKVLKEFPELNLDKLVSGPVIARDIKLPPFKIDYDSHEQIHQKLMNTVILVKNNPFYVQQTVDLGKGKFSLLVKDKDGANSVVKYDDVKDCRGIAPGYFMYRGAACWIYRIPDRQNQQGMHQRNMQYKTAGSTRPNSARYDFLLIALSTAKDMLYAENLQEVMLAGGTDSLRLTDKVALYLTQKKGAPIGVEYCGRSLGLIVNNYVKVMDENDLGPSWIHKDLHRANLVMAA